MSIVDRIREQLDRPDGIRADELEPLAAAYSEEVAKVNQRLTNCSLLLRKGLRSEAIQHASMRPSLLEWAAQLDFPELDDFTEILQFYELSATKQLNRPAVQQLQEAIIEQQPLNELLRQHRWLAIAKAPLGWRLRVLRSIAKLDSLNSLWFEDIEAWEKARLAEIPGELRMAKSARNYSNCKRLADELTQVRWQVSLPQALVESVQTATRELEYDGQCQELKEIGQSLYDSFCAQDESAAQMHRDHWNSLAQSMKRPPPRELSELVEPALMWLQDVDTREIELESQHQAVADLQRILVKPKSVLDVDHAYQLATRSGIALEPTLQRRVQSVLAELQLANRRKTLLRVVSVASLATFLLVALGFWQWRSTRTNAIQKSVASMQQLMADDRLDEAQRYANQLSTNNAYILQDTQVQALLSDLEGRLDIQQRRTDEFESMIKPIEEMAPEQIDVGLLNSAENLARTQAEKSRVSSLRRAQQEAAHVIESQQLANVRSEIERLSAELDKLELRPIEELNHYSFERIINSLDGLKGEYPRAGSTGRDLIYSLTRRATILRQSVQQTLNAIEEKAEALELIHKAGSLEALRQAMESYASKIKDTAAREFSDALKEQSHWPVIDRWNEICAKSGNLTKKPTPEAATELLELIAALEKSIDIPFKATDLPAFKKDLEAIARRPEEFEKMKKILSDSVLSLVYTLEVNLPGFDSPKRYFAYAKSVEQDKNKPEEQRVYRIKGPPGLSSFDIVSENNGAVKKINARTPVQRSNEPMVFVQQLAGQLSGRGDQFVAAWERSFLGLVEQVRDAQNVDSSARESLIALILESSGRGSVYLNTGFRSILETLKKRQAAKPWADPGAPSYVLDDGLLKSLNKAIAEAQDNLRTAHADVRRVAGSSIQWVGSLLSDSQGHATPWMARQPRGDGILLVVSAHPDPTRSDSTQVVSIGKWQDGQPKIVGNPSQLVAGRPVFFIPDP